MFYYRGKNDCCATNVLRKCSTVTAFDSKHNHYDAEQWSGMEANKSAYYMATTVRAF